MSVPELHAGARLCAQKSLEIPFGPADGADEREGKPSSGGAPSTAWAAGDRRTTSSMEAPARVARVDSAEFKLSIRSRL